MRAIPRIGHSQGCYITVSGTLLDINICRHSQSAKSWWRHQMETFSALLAICTGKSPDPGEFPSKRPVTRSFGVFFDLHLKKRLSKQSWGWWFETLSCPLWRHCNRPCTIPHRYNRVDVLQNTDTGNRIAHLWAYFLRLHSDLLL